MFLASCTGGAPWGGAAVANAYGVWGNTPYSRTGAAWANPYTGNYGAANRGVYQNAQTGRASLTGRGYKTNIHTGTTYGTGVVPPTTRTPESSPEALRGMLAMFIVARARRIMPASLTTSTQMQI
jgi:hypothetical protein